MSASAELLVVTVCMQKSQNAFLFPKEMFAKHRQQMQQPIFWRWLQLRFDRRSTPIRLQLELCYDHSTAFVTAVGTTAKMNQ